MYEHRKTLLAVRAALNAAAIAATPALLATAVGVAHGRVAEPIAHCEHGDERVVCAQHSVTDEPVVEREEIHLPPEPGSVVITPPTGHIALGAWHNVDDETHRIVQENLRRQRSLIAPFVRALPAADLSK